MPRKYDYLTKSKIQSGLQCHKKLWFDVHEPLKKIPKAVFEIGNRFGEQVIKNYSKNNEKFLNLTNVWINQVNKTKDAINSKNINIIFEGAFEYLNTQVRVDVLIRKKNGWELLEAKSSTKLKPEHIPDVSIQSFIVRKCLKELGHNLSSIKLIHVNANFILEKEGDYEGLINDENDITEEVSEDEVVNYIQELIPLSAKSKPIPSIEMGTHCTKPYQCDYQDRCKSLLTKSNITPYTILPYSSSDKKIKNYMEENGFYDLQKVPSHLLGNRKGYVKNYHKIIQEAHKNDKIYFNPDLKNIINEFNFPFYFMDFETAVQVVPIIKGTTPYYQLPFQWSVHKWESEDKEINKGESFLRFSDQNIERQFIETLLKAVGDKGTIFAHHAKGVEIKILNKLKIKDSCKDLAKKIENLIDRVEDSLEITKENFYSPLMNGDYSIKSIIKAVPDSDVNYEKEDGLSSGSEAGLAWFTCTNSKTTQADIEKQQKLLIDYCAKDTLAVYYFIKYLMKINK